MPRLVLADLLKRRKMTLAQYMDEFGITTYEGLAARCHRMGVTPPDETAFAKTVPVVPVVSNPTEGIVIVETIVTGSADHPRLWPDIFQQSEDLFGMVTGSLGDSPKAKKKKKDSNNKNEQ